MRHAAAVGLRLTFSAYPARRTPLDAPQQALLEELERRAGPAWTGSHEVPMPQPGDLRAADAVLTSESGRVVVEAVTRLVDLQATLRAGRLKVRDLGADRLVLLVASTHANRRTLRSSLPGPALEIASRSALAALRDGRLPAGDAVILIAPRTDADATAPRAPPAATRPGRTGR